MPRFIITHKTIYNYESDATESYSRLCVTPITTFCQNINSRSIEIEPSVPIFDHKDFFGNIVHEFSVPFRHNHLIITAYSDVDTFMPSHDPLKSEMTVQEAGEWTRKHMYDFYDYLVESSFVPLTEEVHKFAKQILTPKKKLSEAIMELNTAFTKDFTYKSGSTTINTPIDEVLKKREGVCQDFAHTMIACLRSQFIPARYVSGYIESFDPAYHTEGLVGAEQSHAWLDVFIPKYSWFGLDPTNNMISSDQHVRVAIGRDFNDVSPVRGTFKGAGKQNLSVEVKVRRAEYLQKSLQSSRNRDA